MLRGNLREEKRKVGRKPKPKLTLGIDCGALCSSQEKQAGTAVVTKNFLKSVAIQDKKNHYILYSFSKISEDVISLFKGRAQNSVLWPAFGYASYHLPKAISKDKPDVFIGLSQHVPQTNIPSISVIYDLAYEKFPKLYKKRDKLHNQTVKSIENSRHIVTTSESTKEDLINLYKVKEKFISVIYAGVDERFKHKGARRIGTEQYVLFVGSLKNTKNIPYLLHGFNQFVKNIGEKYKLVLVGNDQEKDPEIDKVIKKLRLEELVDVKGYVSEEELPDYFRGALVFVSPSFYEGFGLPLLEAMACGTPVIAANNSSIPEVVGRAGILIDIHDNTVLSKTLKQLTRDENYRKQMIRKGLKHAKKFTWKRFTKEMLNVVYKKVI